MKAKPAVLITGAQRGLGYALCQAYLEKGWAVWTAARRSAPDSLLRLKAAHGAALEVLTLDVSADGSVAAAAVAAGADALDLMINNVGVHFDVSYAALEAVVSTPP